MLVNTLWIVWSALALFAVTITAASATPGRAWQLRICDFPRAQVLTLALLLGGSVGGAALAGAEIPAFVLAIGAALTLAIALQTWWALRLTPLWRVEVRTARRVRYQTSRPPTSGVLRVVTANVDYTNTDREHALERLVHHRPHLLALVETDEAWGPLLRRLEDAYPWQILELRSNGRGMALLSRLPLDAGDVRCLVTDDRPSIWAEVCLNAEERLNMVVLHPVPPGLPRRNADGRKSSRDRDVELAVAAAQIGDRRSRRWIVTGDFNDVGWSRTTEGFKRVSGLVDPRVGRGAYSTFPASVPFARYPIDHVMISPRFRVAGLRRLAGIGSDHLPLLTDLELDTGAIWTHQPAPPKGETGRLVYNPCSGETVEAPPRETARL